MFGSKWKNFAGVSVVSLAAALALSACDNSQQTGDAGNATGNGAGNTAQENPAAGNIAEAPPDDENLTGGEVDTQVERDPAYEDRLAGAEVPNTEDEVADGIDNPYYLAGRAINTSDGEPLGQVTEMVVDDAQNVFAVIELEGAQSTQTESGTVVADVDDIDREQNTLVLMSQSANLEPYVPEDYKPMGVRTEP